MGTAPFYPHRSINYLLTSSFQLIRLPFGLGVEVGIGMSIGPFGYWLGDTWLVTLPSLVALRSLPMIKPWVTGTPAAPSPPVPSFTGPPV